MWNKVFKSRFLKGLENQLIYYFYVLVAILILFFLDAIREMQKYSTEELQQQKAGGMSHLDAQMQMHMRLFRAQRNFYIAGWVTFHHHFVTEIIRPVDRFALFLCLVIKRLVSLISANAGLQVSGVNMGPPCSETPNYRWLYSRKLNRNSHFHTFLYFGIYFISFSFILFFLFPKVDDF